MGANKDLKLYISISPTEFMKSNFATIEGVANKIATNNGISIEIIKQAEKIESIEAEAQIIKDCDIVIADFIATDKTGKDPHPNALLAAVFARFVLGKKLILLQKDEVENYWKDCTTCQFLRSDSNKPLDFLYDTFVEMIEGADTPEFKVDKDAMKEKIFVTTPFQGRFFRVRNDLDFTRVLKIVQQAAETLELGESVITSARKESGEIVWDDIFTLFSSTKLMIADISPDVDSGRFPNAHVLTEYLIAKYCFGIKSILAIRRNDEALEEDWTNIEHVAYDPHKDEFDVENLSLLEILKDKIKKYFYDSEIIEQKAGENVVNASDEISSKKSDKYYDIFDDSDEILEKNNKFKQPDNINERIPTSEMPIQNEVGSEESTKVVDVNLESKSAEDEGIIRLSKIPESEHFEKDDFDTLDYFAKPEGLETLELAETEKTKDEDMINRPEEQEENNSEKKDLPNLIGYDEDNDELKEAAHVDLSDKEQDFTAYDNETEMSLYDPILHEAQSQIYELEQSREKARKRSMSTAKFRLELKLSDESVKRLNNLYKDLKWAVIGKKKVDCLHVIFKIMRLDPFDSELNEFMETFPDLYDEATKEVHQQIIDFMKFDSDKGQLMLVDAEGAGDYLTINEALANSKSGDFILILQGEYNESLSIVDKDLTIRGLTEHLKPSISVADDNVLSMKNSKSIVSNIELKQTGGEGFAALEIFDCSPIIESCEITSDSESCVHINGRNALPFMRYNKLHDGSVGFFIENQARPKIKLNEIWDCKKEGIKVDKVSDPNINQNLIRNNLVGISIQGASKGVYYRNELIANKQENIFTSGDSKPVLKDNRVVTYFKYHLPELRNLLEDGEMEKAQEIWSQLKEFALKDPRLMDILAKYPELDPEFYEQNKDKVADIKTEDVEWDLEPEEMTLDIGKEKQDIDLQMELAEDDESGAIDLEQIGREKDERRKREEEEERQRKFQLVEEERERRNEILEKAKQIARERLEVVEADLDVVGDVYLVDHDIDGAFSLIQDAINHAQDNDVILIAPREYDENLYISNKNITLVGEKLEFAPLIKRESGSCLRLIDTKSKIMSIDFVQKGGGNFYAIDIAGCSPTIENCTITCESIAAVGIHDENADPMILGNRFEKGSIGVKISKSAKGKIVGNEFMSLSKSAISVSSEAEPIVSNNSIVDSFMGIQVANKGRGKFEENTIENITKPGISISKESQCEIIGNKISNLDIGIQIASQSWASLEDNKIRNTHKIGIAATKEAEVIITRNAVKDAQVGIQFTENSGGSIDNNELIRCSKMDLLIGDDCAVEVGHNSTKSIVEDMIEKMKQNVEKDEFEEASEKWLKIFNEEYQNPIVKEILLAYPDFEPEHKMEIRKIIAEKDPEVKLNGYVWIVDSHTIEDRDFDSIQAAVQRATDNDLIIVRPATYEETIIVSRKHLTIMGMPDEYKPKINVTGGFCFRARNTKSVFKNLSINQLGGGNYYAFDISNCSPHIENCELTSQSLAGIGIAGVEANPVIKNNKISGGTSGIAVTNSAQCVIEANEIFENENSGVVINNEAEAKIFKNNIHDIKSTGINAYNTALARVEENELSDCEVAAIGINNQCDIVVKGNKIVRGGLGIIVTENSKCEIVGNEIEKCLEIGITIKNSSEAEINDNSVSRCKKSGILISDDSNAQIVGNEISKNTKDQVIISKNSNPLIKNNTIRGGSFAGISVFEGCKPIIDSNEIVENTKAGIHVNENSDAEIYRNNIWGNATGIIILQQSATLIQENDIYRNDQACIEVFFDSDPVIKNNNLHDGKLFGIILRRHSKGKIYENRIWNNEKVGIRINDGSNPEIRDNLIYDNKWNGIKIHKNGRGVVEGNDIYNNKVGVRIEDPVHEIGDNHCHDNHKNDIIRID